MPEPLRAVLFDVDFTLAQPGPSLSPEGYRRVGERHGLTLEPSQYDDARNAALDSLQHHPEFEHDDEIWIAFTQRIVEGMGGGGEASLAVAREMVAFWEVHTNFELYDDVLPTLELLRARGLKIGLVSNGSRDMAEFVAHHALDVDVALASRAHGFVKPHRSIFDAALAALDVEAGETAMVGDSPADDIEGARALGMRAFLLDREDRHPDWEDRLTDLRQLPAALGLSSG
jgi:HAD superfamily hydrolase (TIGR01549 family)